MTTSNQAKREKQSLDLVDSITKKVADRELYHTAERYRTKSRQHVQHSTLQFDIGSYKKHRVFFMALFSSLGKFVTLRYNVALGGFGSAIVIFYLFAMQFKDERHKKITQNVLNATKNDHVVLSDATDPDGLRCREGVTPLFGRPLQDDLRAQLAYNHGKSTMMQRIQSTIKPPVSDSSRFTTDKQMWQLAQSYQQASTLHSSRGRLGTMLPPPPVAVAEAIAGDIITWTDKGKLVLTPRVEE